MAQGGTVTCIPKNVSVNEGVDLPDGVPGNNCMSYTAL